MLQRYGFADSYAQVQPLRLHEFGLFLGVSTAFPIHNWVSIIGIDGRNIPDYKVELKQPWQGPKLRYQIVTWVVCFQDREIAEGRYG